MAYLSNKQNKEPDTSSGVIIIFIFFITVGVTIYGIFDGFIKVPFYTPSTKEETTTTTQTVVKKKIVFEAIAAGEVTLEDITVSAVEFSNTTITVNAGIGSDMNQYIVPISKRNEEKKYDIYLPKESFVNMNDGIHYLYAYEKDDFYMIGVAK